LIVSHRAHREEDEQIIILHEHSRTGAWPENRCIINEEAFDDLDAPLSASQP